MGEAFYRDLEAFRAKYPTADEQEKALRTMRAEEIMQLARSSRSLRMACWYARFAQEAADRAWREASAA